MSSKMPHPEVELVELSSTEMEALRGGAVPPQLQYAMFFVAAFKAGFAFGYAELGPALFGE